MFGQNRYSQTIFLGEKDEIKHSHISILAIYMLQLIPPQRYTSKHNVDLSLPEIRHNRRYSTDFDENDSEYSNYRKQKLALYRSAINYLSNQISEFVNNTKGDTILSITGDHGEVFWEHQNMDEKMTDSRPSYCFGHGGTPFDVISRVPAGVHTPTSGSVLPEGDQASLRDIPATISELVLEEDTTAPGQPWTDDIPVNRTVISEGIRYGVERKAAYQGKTKSSDPNMMT
jgi:arylsulfatase A-like enzyme